MIGETVGEYKITAALGMGGVGEMFAAEHLTSGAQAAVEIVTPQLTPEATAAYLDRMRKLQTVKHAGVVPILDVGVDAAGHSYVAMAPIEGEPLAKRITDLGRLSITQIAEIARQLASVLAAVHDEGLVHGDVKPSCVFLTPENAAARGEPIKVIEIGAALAKRASGIPVAPIYTAPEVWSANAMDWRIDAYALGCVVFEMATGKPPYAGKLEEIRAKHLSARAPSARSMMPDVPPALDVMLGRLMSKAPEDRYGSMREIARAFETMMGGTGGTQRPAAPTEGTPVFKGEPGVGDETVTSGELKARVTPAKAVEPPKLEDTASIIASGAEHEPFVPKSAPMITNSMPSAGDTTSVRQQGGFPIAIVLVLVLVVGGGIALVAALM